MYDTEFNEKVYEVLREKLKDGQKRFWSELVDSVMRVTGLNYYDAVFEVLFCLMYDFERFTVERSLVSGEPGKRLSEILKIEEVDKEDL